MAAAAQRVFCAGIAGNPRFGIWEGELYRPGPSYTLHSVQHIERVYPNSHLFWIIGGDHLALLPHWYGIEELVRKVGFILVNRPGSTLEWPRLPGLTVYPVPNRLVPVSATDVRARAGRGESLKRLVPFANAIAFARGQPSSPSDTDPGPDCWWNVTHSPGIRALPD